MHSPREKPRFPPLAAVGPDGLLMTGGSLSPDWLLEAYRRGIFPMPIKVERRRMIAWITPDPRGIFELDGPHVSRSLARRLSRGEFQFTFDQAFGDVVAGCAAPRRFDDADDVWLTLAMQNAYQSLFALGHAHSIEVWQQGRLVGGVFGVTVGGLFAGESMFHRATDASKAALAMLVPHLARRGYRLFDVQWTNAHTRSLGAIDIPRDEYLARLARVVSLDVSFGP
ncbi:MAG: leucyl/phenylalanyl-tRNA--protein transferase [Pirellulaceae bacterium]|nr:leucyl/phenylalanyl-tRNA--protein transferase [Pirellulaceae bacterium]